MAHFASRDGLLELSKEMGKWDSSYERWITFKKISNITKKENYKTFKSRKGNTIHLREIGAVYEGPSFRRVRVQSHI